MATPQEQTCDRCCRVQSAHRRHAPRARERRAHPARARAVAHSFIVEPIWREASRAGERDQQIDDQERRPLPLDVEIGRGIACDPIEEIDGETEWKPHQKRDRERRKPRLGQRKEREIDERVVVGLDLRGCVVPVQPAVEPSPWIVEMIVPQIPVRVDATQKRCNASEQQRRGHPAPRALEPVECALAHHRPPPAALAEGPSNIHTSARYRIAEPCPIKRRPTSSSRS